jgi:hypothetical protein
MKRPSIFFGILVVRSSLFRGLGWFEKSMILLFVLVSLAFADDCVLYVSENGTDISGCGLSLGAACKTIQGTMNCTFLVYGVVNLERLPPFSSVVGVFSFFGPPVVLCKPHAQASYTSSVMLSNVTVEGCQIFCGDLIACVGWGLSNVVVKSSHFYVKELSTTSEACAVLSSGSSSFIFEFGSRILFRNCSFHDQTVFSFNSFDARFDGCTFDGFLPSTTFSALISASSLSKLVIISCVFHNISVGTEILSVESTQLFVISNSNFTQNNGVLVCSFFSFFLLVT